MNNTPFSASKQSIQATLLHVRVQEEQHQTLSSKGLEPTPRRVEWWMVLVLIASFLFFMGVLLLRDSSVSQHARDGSNQVIDKSIHIKISPHR